MAFVPPPLIAHDRDFCATGDYINSLRDQEGHPIVWKEPELVSTGQKVKPYIVYRPVSEFLAANQLPKVAGQQKRLKVKEEYSSDLPPVIISPVKSVYLLQRAIEPDEFVRIQPAYLTRYSGTSHGRTHYRRAVNAYVSNLERKILQRMRNVTSSMIAEAICTDEFQEILTTSSITRTASLWTAIHFGFVIDNNFRPSAQEEQARKDVRQIIKWGFGFAAADYFKLCIQRIGIPVYSSDDEGSDNETLDTNTLVDEENMRWEDHDAVHYDHD
ncbi:hypothetical protein BTUL_0054g00640 [Botrytis tulipae]|uniref:Uncharacterized protein n=1 Tax=Botrytis tulipae TaxID=87230 RepID=A0A4Z1EU92_9HELO|nr:hypothetical protein BTUL_0054g00640 [Botrytis tulipae]